MRVRCFMLLLQGCEPLTSQWLLACLRRYRSMTLAWHVLFNVFRWIRTPSPQRHWNGGCYGCNYSPLALVALCQIGLLLLTYINSSRYMDNSNHMDHSEIQILERYIYIYIIHTQFIQIIPDPDILITHTQLLQFIQIQMFIQIYWLWAGELTEYSGGSAGPSAVAKSGIVSHRNGGFNRKNHGNCYLYVYI